MDSERALTAAEKLAVDHHPALRRLIDVTDSGKWTFTHLQTPSDGVIGIHGLRIHPEGYVDSLTIHDATNAEATRNAHDGKVWSRDGDLEYVLNELLELPPPSSPLAPQLVIGSGAQLRRP